MYRQNMEVGERRATFIEQVSIFDQFWLIPKREKEKTTATTMMANRVKQSGTQNYLKFMHGQGGGGGGGRMGKEEARQSFFLKPTCDLRRIFENEVYLGSIQYMY